MKKKIWVNGMKCENCAKHVKEALIGAAGVISADVNLTEKYVIIETFGNVSDETINLAINNEKYNVVGVEVI